MDGSLKHFFFTLMMFQKVLVFTVFNLILQLLNYIQICFANRKNDKHKQNKY